MSNRSLGRIDTVVASNYFFRGAVSRGLGRVSFRPDLVYGHFCTAGAAAAVWSERRKVPVAVAVGESSLDTCRRLMPKIKYQLSYACAFISVSSPLARSLVEEFGVARERIAVIPNGVDLRFFRPRDRLEMRKKFNLPPRKFIVAFVGHFNERKGATRVAAAISGLEGVGGVYVGKGPNEPRGPEVLFCGALPHEQVPEMLCAADVFVLPTLAEGCCNAVIEAMACGLPVITSAEDFNRDVVDNTTGILVPPRDIEAIRNAVVMLRDDPIMRSRLSGAALDKAISFDVSVRASRIVHWLSSMASRPVVRVK